MLPATTITTNKWYENYRNKNNYNNKYKKCNISRIIIGYILI
jgi:hypothetical protein